MSRERPHKDTVFLNMCKDLAELSKDESTQVGCLLVGPKHDIRGTGYNSFPRGINDDCLERQQRPGKYLYFEHAERNAVYNAGRFGVPLDGCRAYLPFPPCADCARALIQVGVTEIICASGIVPERFAENMEASLAMLSEAGIPLRQPVSREPLEVIIGDDKWG